MNKTLSVIVGLATYSTLAQDIQITPHYGSEVRVRQPEQPLFTVYAPVILTPASDFNVTFTTNGVKITKAEKTNTWVFIPAGQTRRFAVESLQSQYEKAISQVILLEDHASFYGEKLDRSAFNSLYQSWGQPACTWITERSTNWIGLQNQWRQVGIIVEEKKLKVVYSGKTNVFTWESKELGTAGPRNMSWQRTNDGIETFYWPNK